MAWMDGTEISTLGSLVACALVLGCSGHPQPYLSRLEDSRRLTADLRVQFNRASEATNRAVMADTDEVSSAAAKEAEQAVRSVEQDDAALAPLIRSSGPADEKRLVDDFEKCFTEYRDLDRRILSLAVENTNLKAQRLSFGPLKNAADAFRDSLAGVAATVAPGNRCSVQELVDKAVLAVREIQVMQGPHIAEADDAVMTRMESEMAGFAAGAREFLKALHRSAPKAEAALGAATVALDKFDELSKELVVLSRRNTNVKSLEMALRPKPVLVMACDDTLRALQAALEKEGSKATR